MEDIDALLRERVRSLSQELVDALLDLEDPPELSPDATRVLVEYVGIAMVAGARQGGREVLAALQAQLNDAGYDGDVITLPTELLAENDVV